MTLQEALKKGKGKARRTCWPGDNRIVADTFGLISLHHNKGKGQFVLSLSDLDTDDWEPYSSKPEKCKACKAADIIEKQDPTGDDGWTKKGAINFTDHLRYYHCTCKEDL